MAQTRKVSRNNTTIRRYADGTLMDVTLHATRVFSASTIREDGSQRFTVCNGGWNTVTTQTRINQCFGEAGLPLRYVRAGGVARLVRDDGSIFPFCGRELSFLKMANGLFLAGAD